VPSPNGSRSDEYYWLRDDTRENPEMLAYLEAENAYRDVILAPVRDLRDKLFEEIIGRMKQDDSTVPYRHRNSYYYTRFEEGREYPIHCRKTGSLDAGEEILLDVNEMAKGHDYYQVAGLEVSHDGNLVAYGEDTVGRRQYTIRIKDLRTGMVLADALPGTSASLAWADDNKTLFYVENDPVTLLSVRVKKHVLGQDPTRTELVYEEKDPSFYMGVGKTGDEKFITIRLSSTVSDELRYLPAGDPGGSFRILAPRERDLEYGADHMGGRWIVRTNLEATNFRLMEVSDDGAGSKDSWQELVPHSDQVYIGGFALFEDYLVISERSEGLQRIRIKPWNGDKATFVRSDEPAYAARIDVNAEQTTDWLRYHYTSLTTPGTIYDINMRTGERKLLKQDEVLGGFDTANYRTERLWATARDGVKVPVSLVYRKGFRKDGTAPLYQYGYGSYGSSSDPRFRSNIISLLDRGFVFAIAHIRGGQEMGRAWYDDGKLLRKRNTFIDFIDVTRFLVAEKYAARDKVVAVGGSAGGLLVGAIANMAPELYRVIVAHVPFVDVVTTMLDESIPLTTNEFDEWGNPKEKKYYDYMLSYSPYDNVTARRYPNLLVTTGLWDSQVQYYEPAKWVARLRDRKTDDNVLVFHVNMEAGHGGKSGRFRRQRDVALEYAFILQQLGMARRGLPSPSSP
jgi:oligopeptidase B